MPVGLTELARLQPVKGIRLGTTAAGVRKSGRKDLVVLECSPGTVAAAVFTRNRFAAAPVLVAREHLLKSAPRALLINTGIANAGSGAEGVADAEACCAALASALGCAQEQVLPFSTGVIGERLPVDRIVSAMPRCIASLSEDGWTEAARGIMTTDTVPKGASRRIRIGSSTISITGIVKGAGMIRPDMATMLAFIATDAAVEQGALARCLRDAVDASFHRITIDGDTSTNDSCVLLATGAAGNPQIAEGDACDALRD